MLFQIDLKVKTENKCEIIISQKQFFKYLIVQEIHCVCISEAKIFQNKIILIDIQQKLSCSCIFILSSLNLATCFN